uniref:Uncharacterized protein n=1 Tax=Ciona savignyi TaxID=51511 RepID=H2ZP07_CIOSA
MIVVEGDVKELKSKDCCRGSAHCNSTPSTSQAAASQSTGSTHHGTERVIITPSPTVVVIQDPSATVVTQQSHASSSTSPCSTPSCSRPSCSRPSCSTLPQCPWSNQGDAHNPRDCFKCRVVRLEKKYTKDSEDRKHMREVHNKTLDKLEANKREEKEFLKSVTGDIRDLRKSVDARTNRANESSSRQIRTLVFRVPPGVDWQRIRAGYNSVVNIVRDDAKFNTMLTVEEYLNFFKLAYQMAEISKWSAEAFMDNFKHHGLVSGKWFPSELYVQAADDFWKIQRTGRWEHI